MSHYDSYFSNTQVGGSLADIGRVYRAPHNHLQRGRGFGTILSGIMRFISPYLLSGSKAIGKEALRSGSEILSNIGTMPIGELLKQQGKKSVKNLAEKSSNKLKTFSEGISGGRVRKRIATDVMKGAAIKRPNWIDPNRIAVLTNPLAGRIKKQVVKKIKKPVVKEKAPKKGKSNTVSTSVGLSPSKKAFLRKYLGRK